MYRQIAVIGSAEKDLPEGLIQLATDVGEEIGKRRYIILTTGCVPGTPYHASRGAKEAGGLAMGYSPALSFEDHEQRFPYLPLDFLEIVVYTGLGLEARSIPLVNSSQSVVVIGGEAGTLREFLSAYKQGKNIGLLKGSGGIVDNMEDILRPFKKRKSGMLLYEENPEMLIQKLEGF